MKCPACSATLPADARYCAACGRPVTDADADPVSFSRVEPHWFGVAPPTFLLGIAIAAVVLAGVFLSLSPLGRGLG